jgi:hypothetical protein
VFSLPEEIYQSLAAMKQFNILFDRLSVGFIYCPVQKYIRQKQWALIW